MRIWEEELMEAERRLEAAIHNACAALEEEDAAGAVTFVERRGKLYDTWKYGSELRQKMDESLLGWLSNHGGALDIGETVVFASRDSKVEQEWSNAQILGAVLRFQGHYRDRILQAVMGDEVTAASVCEVVMEAVEEVFSSKSAKPGTCKELLGDQINAAFRRVWKDDIATGKPKKSITIGHRRFLESRGVTIPGSPEDTDKGE